MNINQILFSTILFFLTISCEQKAKKETTLVEFSQSKYFDEERIVKDKYNVKFSGDDLSFSELELYYSYNKEKKEELLPYILIMIEKHKKYKLCTVAFNKFLEFYSDKEFNYDGTDDSLKLFFSNVEKLSKEQKDFLIYFLKVGKLNDDKASIKYLEIINKQ